MARRSTRKPVQKRQPKNVRYLALRHILTSDQAEANRRFKSDLPAWRLAPTRKKRPGRVTKPNTSKATPTGDWRAFFDLEAGLSGYHASHLGHSLLKGRNPRRVSNDRRRSDILRTLGPEHFDPQYITLRQDHVAPLVHAALYRPHTSDGIKPDRPCGRSPNLCNPAQRVELSIFRKKKHGKCPNAALRLVAAGQRGASSCTAIGAPACTAFPLWSDHS